MRKRSSTEQPAKDSQSAAAKPVWSVPVAVTDIPESGRKVDLAADAPMRETIAGIMGLAGLARLEGAFDLTRLGADGLRVSGRVRALVVQNCVVTLEPVESEIDEAVDLMFTPDAIVDEAAALQSVEADDPPEPLRNGVADLGAITIEFLLLGIDPYPRKPGVLFEPPQTAEARDNPFAALAALKKDEG